MSPRDLTPEEGQVLDGRRAEVLARVHRAVAKERTVFDGLLQRVPDEPLRGALREAANDLLLAGVEEVSLA